MWVPVQAVCGQTFDPSFKVTSKNRTTVAHSLIHGKKHIQHSYTYARNPESYWV